MKLKLILAAVSIGTIASANALVDYSPRPSSGPMSPSVNISNLKQQRKPAMRVARNHGPSFMNMFHFTTGYSSIDLESDKMGIYSFGVTFVTPWKIYFDVDLNYGGKDSEDSEFGMGNTEFSVGATWLEFGQPFNKISIDFIGGLSLGVEESDIGSQRNDSYIGLLTKKNFGTADLSLGFEHWFIDDEMYNDERSIGGFNKYLANIGWTVSRDIRFDLGFQFINLSEVEGSGDISYTEVSPKIGLGINSFLHLTLGANFSSQKEVSTADLSSLKVWNISSLYGNSYFTNLSFHF